MSSSVATNSHTYTFQPAKNNGRPYKECFYCHATFAMEATYCTGCGQQLWPMEPFNQGLHVTFDENGVVTEIQRIPFTDELESPERREQEILLSLRDSTAAAAATLEEASPPAQILETQNREEATAMDALVKTLSVEQLKLLLAAKGDDSVSPPRSDAAPVQRTKARVKGTGKNKNKRRIIEDHDEEIPRPEPFVDHRDVGRQKVEQTLVEGVSLMGTSSERQKKKKAKKDKAGEKRKKADTPQAKSKQPAKKTKLIVDEESLIQLRKDGYPVFKAYYRPQQLGEHRGIKFGPWSMGTFSTADIESVGLCLYFGSGKLPNGEKKEALWVCFVMKTSEETRRIVLVLWNQFQDSLRDAGEEAQQAIRRLVNEFQEHTTAEKNPFSVKQYNFLFVKVLADQGQASRWQQHNLPVLHKAIPDITWFQHICGLVKFSHGDAPAYGLYRRSLNRADKHWRALPKILLDSKQDNADLFTPLQKEMPFLQNFIKLN